MKAKRDKIDYTLSDRCQTPAYALTPLIPYLKKSWTIWESACGEGMLVKALQKMGFNVIGTDILNNTSEDFLAFRPHPTYKKANCIVTNPPYSKKYMWIKRCYEIGLPFALLMPINTLSAAKSQVLFEKYGMGLIVLDKRVNFKMPLKGFAGGGSRFPVGWFTWKLGINGITYAKLNYNESVVKLTLPLV